MSLKFSEFKLSDLYYKQLSEKGYLEPVSKSFIESVRVLRKNMTPAEKIVWSFLRRKQLKGIKFLRQHPINGYVVDFYSREKSLAIEVDGSIYQDYFVRIKDIARQRLLEQYGVQFLRFKNEEVYENIEQVIQTIEETIS